MGRSAHSGDRRHCFICRTVIRGKAVHHVSGKEVGQECYERLEARNTLRSDEGGSGGACSSCGAAYLGKSTSPCVDLCCLCCSSSHKEKRCPLQRKKDMDDLLGSMFSQT